MAYTTGREVFWLAFLVGLGAALVINLLGVNIFVF